MLFTKTPQIYTLIDEHAAWKFEVHPYLAGAHRSLLIRFAKSQKISNVEDITEEHIAYFVGGELSAYYSHTALKAFRSFLWYANHAGYDCLAYNRISAIRKALEGESKVVAKEAASKKWIAGLVGKWKY